MESGDEDAGAVVQTVEGMTADKKTAAVIRLRKFTTADKGTARGLEAADFVAWHWNKYYWDKVRSGRHDNPRKDFAALVAASKNKYIQYFSQAKI
jgi:hypothetical protein